MRVIKLDGSDEAKRLFVVLYTAARSGTVEGIDQIRRVGKIMDKLEAAAVSQGEGDTQSWELLPAGAEIWLEGNEFTELRNRVSTTKWRPDAVRTVAKAIDLLDAAPEQDPGKPRVVPDGEPLAAEA